MLMEQQCSGGMRLMTIQICRLRIVAVDLKKFLIKVNIEKFFIKFSFNFKIFWRQDLQNFKSQKMSQNQHPTSYQDDYTWPIVMPVKIFNTDYSCPKVNPKKIGFEPTKEFTSKNVCKPKMEKKAEEKSPQLVFINIHEAKEVNFQNISCGSNQSGSKPQNKSLNLFSNDFRINIKARPKTTINPNSNLSQFACEKRKSNPDLTILANHVNKSKNMTNSCKCPKNKPPQVQQPKPCRPETRSKPREAPNAKKHEIKVCPNHKELLEKKQPPANKLDVKLDPCEAFPDDHWNTTYQEEFGFVKY